MKRNYIVMSSLFLIVLLVFMTGCASNNAPVNTGNQPATPAATQAKPVIIGFALGTLKEERWQKDRDFFVSKVTALGGSVNVVSADADKDLQVTQVENLIAQRVDVIVIVSEDQSLIAPLVEKAHQAGIKVIAYDRLIKNADVDAYVSFQNEKVGTLQANRILQDVSKGNFVYIGGAPTDNNAFQFKKGAMDALSSKIASGDIKLVYDQFTTDWKPEIAYQNMKAVLANGTKVDAVIAANDGTASGVIKALAEVGLAGKIPVSGQDAELGACQKIVEGTQTMTVYKPIEPLAEKAAELAMTLAQGKTPETNGVVNNGKIDVPSYLLEPVMVDKSNMMTTVIKDGFNKYADVYQNVPVSERPPQ